MTLHLHRIIWLRPTIDEKWLSPRVTRGQKWKQIPLDFKKCHSLSSCLFITTNLSSFRSRVLCKISSITEISDERHLSMASSFHSCWGGLPMLTLLINCQKQNNLLLESIKEIPFLGGKLFQRSLRYRYFHFRNT